MERWFVVPCDPFAEMKNIGRVVQRFPAFGQIGLHDEGPGRNRCADFMPHELTVDKAQRGMRLEAIGLMRVKVGRIIPAHAQDTATLGEPRFGTPERRRVMQWPGGQRDASRQASLEQSTTAHTLDDTGLSLEYFHTSPFCVSRTGGAAQPRTLQRILGLIYEAYDTASRPQQRT